MKIKDFLLHHPACYLLLLITLIVAYPYMAICAIPTLDWAGEYGLWNDGVTPDYGLNSSDSFTFKILYQDADNNPPQAGYPIVHIKKSGVDISGSPFVMAEVDNLDSNYQDGKLYTYTTTLNSAGTDYTYTYEAYDSTIEIAYGSSTNKHTLTVVTGYIWVDQVLGSDTTGNGTEGNPYQTITQGISVATSGQAVRVRGGTIASPYTYNGSLTMVNGVHLVSDNANGGDSEAVYDDPYSTYQASMLTRAGRVVLQGGIIIPSTLTEDVLVDGITISYLPGKSTMDIQGNSPVIRNSIIRRPLSGGNYTGATCVEMSDINDITTTPIIENNLLHSVGIRAIGIGSQTSALIQDNEIWNTGQQCIAFNRKGIPGGEITILNNHISQCGAAGIGSAALVKDLKVTIQGNSIHDSGLDATHFSGAGIGLSRCCDPFSSLEIIIGGSAPDHGNHIYNNRLGGIRLDGNGQSLSPTLIQNNHIYNNGKAGMLLIDVGHPGDGSTPEGVASILDNNIYDHVNGAGINIGGETYGDIAYNSIHDNKAGIAFNMGGVEFDPPQVSEYNPLPFHDSTLNIKGNDIYSNTMAGIIVKDIITGTINIIENDIYQNDRGGIGILNSCNLVINRNDIHNNIRGGIHTGTDVANDVFNDELLTDTEGFIGLPDTALMVVTQNKVHNNGLNSYGGGIDIRHGTGVINNNLVYKNRMGGIRFGDYTSEIVNNTVVENGDEVQDKGGGIIYDDLAGAVNDQSSGTPPAPIPIRNNISIFNTKAGIKDAICKDLSPILNTDRNYNLLYMNNRFKYTYPAHAPSNLGGCFPNSNELFAEPLFVDQGNDNYRIQSGSPATDAGDSAYGSDVSIPPGVSTITIDMGAFGGTLGIDW